MTITDPELLRLKKEVEESQGLAPRKEEPSSSEAREMLSLQRPNEVVQLPGDWKKYQARVWRLNDEEEVHAKVRAHEYLDRVFSGKDVGFRLACDPSLLTDEIERQRLAIAIRRVADPSKPLFTPDEIRKLFGPDDRRDLLEKIAEFTAKRDPLLHAANAEEALGIVKQFAGGAVAPLDWLRYCDGDTAMIFQQLLVDLSTGLIPLNSSPASPLSSDQNE